MDGEEFLWRFGYLCFFGDLDIWHWISGSWLIWIPGSLAFRISGSWLYGSLALWLSGSLAPGSMDLWLSGSPDLRLLALWISGFWLIACLCSSLLVSARLCSSLLVSARLCSSLLRLMLLMLMLVLLPMTAILAARPYAWRLLAAALSLPLEVESPQVGDVDDVGLIVEEVRPRPRAEVLPCRAQAAPLRQRCPCTQARILE